VETPPAPAAGKLQILATEHWSLLATRSLTYTESLGRVNVFLAILSGAVIALALVAQADHFGPTFVAIAVLTLLVVLFTGIATIARLMHLNRDDYRWVIGMNRLRHAYLELHPELEPNFITSPYDDVPGALRTLGIDITAEPIPPSRPNANPKAVTGIAVWDDVDPDSNLFSVYVAGLSNGWSQTDNPISADKEPVIRRKTLQLNFKRLGDRYNMSSDEIHFVGPYQWIYRASELSAGSLTPAKPGEKAK